MSDYHINIFYSEEDSGYIADIPDLESCSAFGNTPEKALAEVEQAKEAWIEPLRQTNSGATLSSHNLSSGVIIFYQSFPPGFFPVLMSSEMLAQSLNMPVPIEG
jgi:predicted RNase H-like HicB family nuclease